MSSGGVEWILDLLPKISGHSSYQPGGPEHDNRNQRIRIQENVPDTVG